jgi:hypothetical protein
MAGFLFRTQGFPRVGQLVLVAAHNFQARAARKQMADCVCVVFCRGLIVPSLDLPVTVTDELAKRFVSIQPDGFNGVFALRLSCLLHVLRTENYQCDSPIQSD